MSPVKCAECQTTVPPDRLHVIDIDSESAGRKTLRTVLLCEPCADRLFKRLFHL